MCSNIKWFIATLFVNGYLRDYCQIATIAITNTTCNSFKSYCQFECHSDASFAYFRDKMYVWFWSALNSFTNMHQYYYALAIISFMCWIASFH